MRAPRRRLVLPSSLISVSHVARSGDLLDADAQKTVYGQADPLVPSTLVGTTRLALPEQPVEIKFVA